VDAREERVLLNEAVFREVNEGLQSVQGVATLLDLVCECGRPECIDKVEMTREAYEQLRSDPTHFAVARGHETSGIEFVVERHPGYDVVQKRPGEPEELAEETDPRSD
jgi:hypothetical protein